MELLTKREKLWLVCVGIVFELAILASMALPQELVLFDRTSAAVMLTWDANTEPDMARYTVYTWRGDTATAALTVPHPQDDCSTIVAPRRPESTMERLVREGWR